MSFKANNRDALDPSLSVSQRMSHLRSCAVLVAEKHGVSREVVIERVAVICGVDITLPASDEEIQRAARALAFIKRAGVPTIRGGMGRTPAASRDGHEGGVVHEEWTQIVGGSPVHQIWSDGDEQERLSAVERALLEATLSKPGVQHGGLIQQAAQARCSCREFTGCGVYLHLFQSDFTRALSLANGVGGASINWAVPSRCDLGTVVFLERGRLSLLEIFPCDGEGWSVEECRRLLVADVSSVVIRANF